MTTARNSARGALLLDHDIFIVVGGFGNGARLSSCEKLDVAMNKWSSAANLSLGVRSTHASVLFNNKVIVLGGHNGSTYQHM
jgi:hypothetical protein